MKTENIFSKLKTDHDEIKGFLSKLEKDPTDKSTFNQLEQELSVHDEAEEKAFYAPLKEKIGDLALLMDISTKEHELVSTLIQHIKENKLNSKDSAVLISFLKKSLEGHIKKEENEVFQLAHNVFTPEEIDEITELFDQIKDDLKHS